MCCEPFEYIFTSIINWCKKLDNCYKNNIGDDDDDLTPYEKKKKEFTDELYSQIALDLEGKKKEKKVKKVNPTYQLIYDIVKKEPGLTHRKISERVTTLHKVQCSTQLVSTALHRMRERQAEEATSVE